MADRLASVADLRGADILWLTTVSSQGQPQSSPVWFHWDGSSFLILSRPDATKVVNIGGHPRVALHLDGGSAGTTIVTIEGVAAITDSEPTRRDAYVAKYRDGITRLGTDPVSYLAEFSAGITVTPARARVFPSL
jgi:PPOX class probable F420-dependent enzyme